ncbi:MAG: cell division protein FtsZ [Bacteroidetes bacterium]|nr:cell division protein FtsZ [Bacteroidota bacterium]
MQFDLPKEKSSIIKVIGVGGGGSNAVNHMYKQGIKDVDFIVCNTDRQVLDSSPVPLKIQLGAALTEGLGAGSLPEMGMKAALENEQELRNALAKTKMLFITAGMGGGTGTGAAPVIAKIAREMGILTVSICTLPFSWEGKLRKKQAEEGLAELKKYSDSVLVILNDKIREIYHNLKVGEAFAHADNVLTSAAKCIAELINVALTINVDFNDVRRVMENSGVAIMGSAMANGEGRALKAVTQALNSPLLNDNDIRGARYVLVSITCGAGKDELTMDELAEITDYVQEAAGQTAEMIKGYGTNDTLGEKVSVTIIASGFERKNTDLGLTPQQPEVKMIHLNEVKPVLEKKEETKVEVSKMTEPMLKSEVIEDKKEEPVSKKEVAQTLAEVKKEEILIELKKVEEKPVELKRIEVKFEPVVSEVKEEVPQIIAETTPPVVETEEVPVVSSQLPVDETTNNEQLTCDKIIAEEKIEEEPFVVPFLLVKENEQKSIEFDLTEEKPVVSGQLPVAETTNNEQLPTDKKEEPKVEVPPVNMDVKRSFISLPGMSDNDTNSGESKVTKIGDVHLNSVPPISDAEAKQKAQEKIQKLRELSFKVKTPGGLAELENEPAYKRKNVVLNDTPHSSESEISRLTLGTENPSNGATNKTPSLRPDNSFLHDKPD